MPEATIEVGDYVTIGKRTLTWKVEELRVHSSYFGPRIAGHLVSGQSGRSCARWIEDLHLHTKGTP